MAGNVIQISVVTVSLGSTAQSLKSVSGFDLAKEVIIRPTPTNSGAAFLNGAYPIYKTDQPLTLEAQVNRMSQSTKYDLSKLTLGGTSGDSVEVILIDPEAYIAG